MEIKSRERYRVDDPGYESGMDIIRESDSEEIDEDKIKELRESFEADVFGEEDEIEEDVVDKPEEDDSTEEFIGFDEKQSEDTPTAPVDPVLAELQGMTPEQFTELTKKDPGKALEMMITATLHKKGITGMTYTQVQEATRNASTVQDVRRIIAQRFKPGKNKELRERAVEIYKARGFDVKKNPQAELDAFILASQAHPELDKSMGEPDNQVTPRGNRRRSNQTPEIRLSKEHVAIAKRMGVDLGDPKTAKRMVRLINDYERRRR